jgi:hypothetical protein
MSHSSRINLLGGKWKRSFPNEEIESALARNSLDDRALCYRMCGTPAGICVGAGRNHVLRPMGA